MAPLVLYALMGSSGALAVGPAAVTSLMTAASVGAITTQGSMAYTEAALMLALISGLMMLVMGALRLGFLAHF
jgi:SulP family sulfate permease